MKARGQSHDLAVEAIEAVLTKGLAGIASSFPPLTQLTRARPADHLMNGSTPAGNVDLELS